MNSTRSESTNRIPRRLRARDLEAVAGALGVRLNGDRLRAPCPVHGGDDDNLSVWVDDEDFIAFYCHSNHCAGIHARVRDLVIEGGYEGNGKPPDRLPSIPIPSRDQLAEWSEDLRSGSTDVLAQQLATAGWTEHRDALADLGVGHDGNRIVFPVEDGSGELIGVTLYAPGAEIKSRCPRGQRRGLFPAPESIDSSVVYVFEGEPDAVTATLGGLPAVGVPGVKGWRSEYVERFKGRTVFVCFDCDEQGRKAAERIVSELSAAGIYAVRLDLAPERTDGFDFRDLAREVGLPAARDCLCRLIHIETPDLLGQISRFLGSYVVFADDSQPDALALWVLHTWAIDAAEQSPYMVITAPEKRCGKTMLRDALSEIVRRPWQIDAAPTEAVLFRRIDKHAPTVLLDEADALFAGSRERVEPLRALFNGGNRRGATVPRCVGEGKNTEVQDFEIFSAKALVGIDASRWPDTIRDRAIEIVLRRKRRDETVTRFRRREVAPLARKIRDACAAWASPDRLAELADAHPALPDALGDRAADGWEPLFAIADMAKGEWPERAREIAQTLSGTEDFTTDSRAVRLLADVASIFERHGDRISTAELLEALHALDESPWGDDPALNARGLAEALRPFGIRRTTVRLSDTETAKGYKREDFADAFSRYLSGVHSFKRPSGSGGVTSVTSVTTEPQSQAVVTHVTHVTPPGRRRARPRINPARSALDGTTTT